MNEKTRLDAAQHRQIIDVGDIENSRWIVAPGQSGLPSSPHYDGLLERWQQVTYMRMW